MTGVSHRLRRLAPVSVNRQSIQLRGTAASSGQRPAKRIKIMRRESIRLSRPTGVSRDVIGPRRRLGGRQPRESVGLKSKSRMSARGSTALRPKWRKRRGEAQLKGQTSQTESQWRSIDDVHGQQEDQPGNTQTTRGSYPSAVDCTEMADDYCCQDASRADSPRLISGCILRFCSPPAIEFRANMSE